MQIEIGFVLGLTDLQITIVRLETRLNVLAAYARLQMHIPAPAAPR
jgi:hypothetical protein